MKWEEEGTELLITESDTGMGPSEKIFRQIGTVGLLLSFNPMIIFGFNSFIGVGGTICIILFSILLFLIPLQYNNSNLESNFMVIILN